MIKVESILDATKANALLEFQLHNKRKLFFLVSSIFAIIGVLVGLFFEDWLNGIVIILSAIMIWPLIRILSKTFQKKLDKSMQLLSQQTFNNFKFDEEYFHQETIKGQDYYGTSRSKYSLISNVYETELYFFIYISNAQAHIIDKNDIIAGNVQDLHNLLSSKLQNKFIIKYKI